MKKLKILSAVCGCTLVFVLATGADTAAIYSNLSTVPVPAVAWLCGSSLGLLVWIRRRAAASLPVIQESSLEKIS